MFDKKFYENTDFNACNMLSVLITTAEDNGNCRTLSEVEYYLYEDYKYVHYKDAERALQNAGVFDCFQVVHDYIMEVYGEDNTDYMNPIEVADTLFAIQGKKITQAVAEWLGVGIDDDLDPENWNKLLCADIKNIMPFLDTFHSFTEHV